MILNYRLRPSRKQIETSSHYPTVQKAITGWQIEKDLLNVAKTEVLAVGTRPQIARLDISGDLVVSWSTIAFSKKLHLEWPWTVILHLKTTSDVLSRYATAICMPNATSVCWSTKMPLTPSLVPSWGLDWTTAMPLYGTTKSNLNRLQCIQNSLTRIVYSAP